MGRPALSSAFLLEQLVRRGRKDSLELPAFLDRLVSQGVLVTLALLVFLGLREPLAHPEPLVLRGRLDRLDLLAPPDLLVRRDLEMPSARRRLGLLATAWPITSATGRARL